MWFWIVLAVVAAAVLAYTFRVQLMAKVLGQSEGRVQRAIDRKKTGRG